MEESLTQNLTESIKNVLGLKEISPAQLSPLVLAYIGDSIFDLVIKTYLLDTKGNMQVNKLNRFASNIVKAQSQSEMIGIIEPLLSPAEEAVYKRGRNAKSYTSANRRATGFEALMGYLYLEGEYERMIQLIKAGLDKEK